MQISYEYEDLPFCCGVTDVGGFDVFWEKGDWRQEVLVRDPIASGTGMFTATFVNTAVCKKAYETLREHYNLMYQSPRFKNIRSGREVFLCVFEGADHG